MDGQEIVSAGDARATLAPVIGLTAIIVAVTDEIPRILVVRRMTHARATPAQKGLPADSTDSPDALPFGPLEPERHRTLERGLRTWVEEQTGLPLRYVEQLYTFGDRYRDTRELRGGPRFVTVGYIALVRQARPSGSGEAAWCDWYGFLPWEDWRDGRPALIDDVIVPGLESWSAAAGAEESEQRRERAAMTFGLGEAAWDFERVLERYELLYQAELVVEAIRDRLNRSLPGGGAGIDDRALATARRLGAPMALDDRRIVASALGRMRGKLKYRPVVFDLLLDDRRIVASALGRMRGKLKYRPVVFDLLPPLFTLFRLQRVVEACAGVRLHKQNFRRLVINGRLVEATGHFDTRTGGRPAKLFRFRHEVLRERSAPGVGIPAMRVED